MRQIESRASATTRPKPAAGRTKAKSRSPQVRSEPRGRSRSSRGGDSVSFFVRVRNSFPFRRPILTLTLALVVTGAVTGVIAGGYFGKVIDRMEVALQSRFTDAGFGIKDIAPKKPAPGFLLCPGSPTPKSNANSPAASPSA
jgi:hypothetical protein